MLGINCLIKHPEIQQNLSDIVEMTGNELAARRGSAKIDEVYNVLRSAGMEVDIQTLSHIYENVFDSGDETFSNPEEISNARQDTYKKMASLEAKIKNKSIGRDKPSVAAAANVMKSLIQDINIKTVQKQMEDRLTKAAKRVLGVKAASSKKSLEELLQEVLSTQRPNDFHGLGVMDNAEALFDEMGKEMEQQGMDYKNAQMEQFGRILKGATFDVLASQGEINRMITDTLKDSGFTREVGGKLVIDWDKIIAKNADYKALLNQLFERKGIDATHAGNLVDVLDRQYKELKANKIEAKLKAKNKAAAKTVKPVPKSAIEKLVELDDLNIFNSAQQDALAAVSGLSDLSQEQVSHLRNILKHYKAGQQIPMSKFSQTYIKTMQRQVEVFVNSFDNQNSAVNVMAKLQSYMQFSNVAILANPQNIGENVLSGLIESFVVQAVNNPRGFFGSIADFGNKLVDYVKGGVREGEERSNAFNRGGNIEDIYNRETKGGKRLDVILSSIPRVVLGAMDNGAKKAIAGSQIQWVLRKYLVQKGATRAEANLILNNIYYGNNDQINDIARQLSGRIVMAGVNTETTTDGKLNAKERVIASELALANMQTDGTFFQDMLSDMIASGKIRSSLKGKLKIDEKLLFAIREAAYSTASKGLGHEADNMLLKMFDTRYEALDKKMKENRANGNHVALAGNMMMKTLFAGVNKFRSGGFNWLWLGFQKASGAALLSTLVTDVALGRTFGITRSFKGVDFGNEETIRHQLSTYLALRQRLIRETVPVIASLAISAGAIALIKGAGDDEDKKRRARELKRYLDDHSGMKRWFNKISPQILYNYVENVNAAPLDKLPLINKEGVSLLKDNDIADVSLSNIERVSEVLGLDEKGRDKLTEAVNQNNAAELPNLFAMYFDPMQFEPSLKMNSMPNPVVQLGIDLVDRAKPDKAAVFGQATGNVLNLGGVLRSYDIWKNAIKNPEKIEGEYKMIKPNGGVEGFAYQTLNKDLYKKFFVNSEKLKMPVIDLPFIGKKGVSVLEENGIHEVTKDNMDAVQDILKLKDAQMEKIGQSIDFHDEKVKRILGQ